MPAPPPPQRLTARVRTVPRRARLPQRRSATRRARGAASSAVDLLQHGEVVEQLVLDLHELAQALLVRAEPLGQRIDVEPRLKGQRR